jgi:hypothetical protein
MFNGEYIVASDTGVTNFGTINAARSLATATAHSHKREAHIYKLIETIKPPPKDYTGPITTEDIDRLRELGYWLVSYGSDRQPWWASDENSTSEDCDTFTAAARAAVNHALNRTDINFTIGDKGNG